MRPLALLALAVLAAAQAGCLHRRCGTWKDAACRAQGEPAGASALRVYALGDAGRSGDARTKALAQLRKVVAAEEGAATRVLAVLGNNVYERGPLSSEKDLQAAQGFYWELFKTADWKTVVVVPGNYDHGGFRHNGFDAKALSAQAKWFRALRADVVFPSAADPRTESPWTSVAVPGHERCVVLQATDSQGFRENLLAQPAPKADAAWNIALAHHPTRTAANHMGDRTRDEYDTYAKALEPADLLLAAHENVLFADLDARDASRRGPPNIVSGSFSTVKRLKAPEHTSCAAEQPGFVRLSVIGDALVADFFAFGPDETPGTTPYCTRRIEKVGAADKCLGRPGPAEAATSP